MGRHFISMGGGGGGGGRPPQRYGRSAAAADGNCFFRSISLVVTGSQDFHQELRLSYNYTHDP